MGCIVLEGKDIVRTVRTQLDSDAGEIQKHSHSLIIGKTSKVEFCLGKPSEVDLLESSLETIQTEESRSQSQSLSLRHVVLVHETVLIVCQLCPPEPEGGNVTTPVRRWNFGQWGEEQSMEALIESYEYGHDGSNRYHIDVCHVDIASQKVCRVENEPIKKAQLEMGTLGRSWCSIEG